jgi:hypothetical protein
VSLIDPAPLLPACFYTNVTQTAVWEHFFLYYRKFLWQ